MSQTSSVSDFDKVFCHLEQDVAVTADMNGNKLKWPSVASVLDLAADSFRHLKSWGLMEPLG